MCLIWSEEEGTRGGGGIYEILNKWCLKIVFQSFEIMQYILNCNGFYTENNKYKTTCSLIVNFTVNFLLRPIPFF